MEKNYMRNCQIYGIMATLSVCACNSEETTWNDNTKEVTVVVSIPHHNAMTRVNIVQDPQTLALVPSWNDNDKIHTFATVDLNNRWETIAMTDLGEHEIGNISSDRKKCEFNPGIDNDFGEEYKEKYGSAYQGKLLYGTCGRKAKVVETEVHMVANMYRTTTAEVLVPVWFEVKFERDFPEAVCQYVGTFELLHIKNESDKDIVFRWDGYDAAEKWYYEYATFMPHAHKAVELHADDLEDDIQVDAITVIPSGEERTLVSWYVPSGKKFTNAALMATIDDKQVQSVNRKSSNSDIQQGHVYHLYANWDGTHLYIDNFCDSGLTLGDVVNVDL